MFLRIRHTGYLTPFSGRTQVSTTMHTHVVGWYLSRYVLAWQNNAKRKARTDRNLSFRLVMTTMFGTDRITVAETDSVDCERKANTH